MFSFSKEDPDAWPEYYIFAGIELVPLRIIKDTCPVLLGKQKDRDIKLILYDLELHDNI